MRSTRLLPLLLSLSLAACASPESTDDDAGAGTGGVSSEGGASGSTGGGTGSGAQSGSNGSGGNGSGSGGSVATGGRTGATGFGGQSGSNGSGGVTSLGGTTGSGGAAGSGGGRTTGSGGAAGKGGATGSGGVIGKAGATGSGGVTGSGGAAGSAGANGNPAICRFASGLNVAWVNFAGDIPNPSLPTFNTIFQNTHTAGGRVVRWWLHTNGTVTPGYDSSGKAMALTSVAMSGLTSVVNAAHTAGIALNISLWSFDMLQGGENITTTLRTNNQNLLTVDANRQAYIDNVLTPMVTALKGNPGVYSYEIFNEPEGMTTQHGWTMANGGSEVDQMYIQKTVNWFAAAIHAADPDARVTSGAQTFGTCSNGVSGMTNLYSNSALVAAGGKSNGTLDFYEVHYYTSNGANYSCFTHPASHWGLDKNVVMGEFYAITTDGVNGPDTYTSLYNNGYNGAWAWNYETNDDGNTMTDWPTMQAPMQNLWNAQMATLAACP